MTANSLLHQTPWSALLPLRRDRVIVGERTYRIDRPADSNRVMTHPSVLEKAHSSQFMPYWAELWPAGRMLAKYLIRQSWPAGLTALEIGCGLGLPGIVALSQGLRVIFSDCDQTAVELAGKNARLNGLHNFELLPFDWRRPPTSLRTQMIIGSDLIYDQEATAPLVDFMDQVLEPNGVALIADPDRTAAPSFREMLKDRKFRVETKITHAGEPNGDRIRGTVHRITRAC